MTLIGAASLALYLVEKGISFSTSGGLPPETSTSADRLFADCQTVVMRMAMPAEGHIYVLQPREQPEGIGEGLMDFFGPPGSEWNQTDSNGAPAWGYRCELTNHSNKALLNVSILVHLTFKASVPAQEQEKARREGEVVLVRDWRVSIPKIDPFHVTPYVFYIWNKGVQRFIHVRLPDEVWVEDARQVPLVQSERNLFQPLNPDPFN